jgi:predicted lipid-binding transport protein (Tim44 family)
MDMQLVSQLLTGQLPVMAPTQTAESPRRRMARYGFLTSISGILLAALLGVLGGAFSNLDGDLGAFVASLAGIGGLVFMAGLFMMLYSLFLPKAATPYQPPQQLPQAQPFMQMPPERFRAPASSVTENTTELLDTPEAEPGPRNVRRRSE